MLGYYVLREILYAFPKSVGTEKKSKQSIFPVHLVISKYFYNYSGVPIFRGLSGIQMYISYNLVLVIEIKEGSYVQN